MVEDISELFSKLKNFRLLNFTRISIKNLLDEGMILELALVQNFPLCLFLRAKVADLKVSDMVLGELRL